MSSPAIRVRNLSKQYQIGARQKGYKTFREAIGEAAAAPLRRFRRLSGMDAQDDNFWALKDVSFDVQPGEVLGIIGRNGAGKSTLLKVLSKITEPTAGRVEILGRVASLLEVGTGFHPELTGRENIFLNGAILGMSRAEIRSRFDEIVDFSEIEEFIDTPVKRYSSGMYVRLAFAVAAHLEPEILIVDEVLAVGDAQFQRKCLAKMGEVSTRSGRTVLLVSHTMSTVQAICDKALVLASGSTHGVMDVHTAVTQYLGNATGQRAVFQVDAAQFIGKEAFIREARLLDAAGNTCTRFPTCEPVAIELRWSNKGGVPVNANFMLVNHNNVPVMIAFDTTIDWNGEAKRGKGEYISRAKIPANLLNSGDYAVHIALDRPSPRFCYGYHLDALRFSVWDPMDARCIARGSYTHVRDDAILWPALEWKWEPAAPEPANGEGLG